MNLGGLLKFGGIEAGMKYAVEFGRMLVWAHRTENEAAMKVLVHIEAVFLKEISDETGDVKDAAIGAAIEYIITGKHDPTAGSRHETQGAIARFKADSDTWWAAQ